MDKVVKLNINLKALISSFYIVHNILETQEERLRLTGRAV